MIYPIIHSIKIPLTLILIGLMLSACTKNIVTLNEAEIANMTDEQIIEINTQACAYQDGKAILVRQSHPAQQRFNTIEKMLPNQISNQPLNYKIYLDLQPQAFSTLNGCIRLNSGLFDLLDNDELVAVIGHEIAHIELGHSLTLFKQAQAIEIDNYGHIELLSKSGLTNDQEFEADEYAVTFLRSRGINPSKLSSLLQKLAAYQTQKSATHPMIEQRIERLNKKSISH